MKTLLIATRNRDKAREFQEMLGDLDVIIKTLDDFQQVGEIDEDADTLEGNALKKAREAYRLTGVPSVADDTGLEVGYLNGEPGVYSARYAGPGATYDDNCAKLLRHLRGVPPRRRNARFRCVIAFIPNEGTTRLVDGVCRGVITETPKGQNGFGYDPVFLPIGHGSTFGEMTLEEKNTVSHRARAIAELRRVLPAVLAET
jgi:XTP/dITP diphosphohydrolase